MAIKYPTIDDASLIPLRAVEALLKQTPDLLQRDDCPYSPSVREFLGKKLGKETVVARVEFSDDDLDSEIAQLYADLKIASRSTFSDPKDKIAMLKTTSELLTKMVTLRGQVLNIRQMSLFQKTVVQVLENICTPAQRSEVIELLGKHIDLSDVRPSLLGQEHPGHPAPSAGEGPPT